jgi:pimeloyl-ACP methyl ester carboxylesterase
MKPNPKSLSAVALLVMLAALAASITGCAAPDDEDAEAASDDSELIGVRTRCGELSHVPGMDIERVTAEDGHVHLRVGTMTPRGTPKGDVLFLHGFSDRFDNHLPLFEGFRRAGLRVVAFDYPSHGETCGRGLDRYRIKGIAELASFVEEHTRQADDRPLVVAGWSTGGLVAVRMLQAPSFALGREIRGAFLLAPGVDVKVLVGDKQIVTQETLTSHPNPPHRGPISPRSPLQTPLFATDLIVNARHARAASFPRDVPTFVVTGGEKEDVYANTRGVVTWVRARQDEGARVFGLTCPGGRHELDNEAEPMGGDVRANGVAFASWVAGGGEGEPPVQSSAACATY